MSLTIKNFTVLNTTSGQMPITGMFNSTILSTILSYITYTSNVTEEVAVPGTPTAISSGGLSTTAHMSTSYIKITKTLGFSSGDTVYVPDNFLRLTYLGGFCGFSNTLLYGFTNNLSTSPTSITWNVAFAVDLMQTAGDYIDIELPNPSSYPSLYVAFILLANVWQSRTVVNENICSINSSNAQYSFCINPTESSNDTGSSHFIIMQGKNVGMNIFSHIVIGMEDNIFSNSDKDYNDFTFSIGSRYITDTQLNDTNLS
jgi:hypothetical protein